MKTELRANEWPILLRAHRLCFNLGASILCENQLDSSWKFLQINVRPLFKLCRGVPQKNCQCIIHYVSGYISEETYSICQLPPHKR